MKVRELVVVATLSAVAVLSIYGCAAPTRAAIALGQNRLNAGISSLDVAKLAGAAGLYSSDDGTEHLYYDPQRGSGFCVDVKDGLVVAVRRGVRPTLEQLEATEDADRPVGRGSIRVGMDELTVRSALGDPSGVSASASVETFHYVTDEEIDSYIVLDKGIVVGYGDKKLPSMLGIPSSDSDTAATDGRVRVGMSATAVKRLLGEPDEIKDHDGLRVHEYKSHPFIGTDYTHTVTYANDLVLGFGEINEDLAEDVARREAWQAEQEAWQAEQERDRALAIKILSDPGVQQALRHDYQQRQARTRSTTVKSSSKTRTRASHTSVKRERTPSKKSNMGRYTQCQSQCKTKDKEQRQHCAAQYKRCSSSCGKKSSCGVACGHAQLMCVRPGALGNCLRGC